MDDTAAALNGAGETTGEPVGARAPPELPEGLWKRRVAKEKQDKEQALKEKELLQKDWMKWPPSWNWPRQVLGMLCQ